MKKIEDYLHFYLGCEVKTDTGKLTLTGIHIDKWSRIEKAVVLNGNVTHTIAFEYIKPILRQLSDMTEEEANLFAWLCLDSEHHLDDETKVSRDEIDTDLHKNDNATMLDGDIEIYIEVSCRCYEGAVVIRKDGSITLWNNEDEADERIDGMAFKIKYLLSKHFDLFGLIEFGLAIDKTTLK